MLDLNTLDLLREAVEQMESGFAGLPATESRTDEVRIRDVLARVAERMHDNFPYPHPLYAGQMLKPPHPIAQLAYGLAMYLNPNNHAIDGGRASSAMEKEAVAGIAGMFGWTEHLGHLCSGGTMANLEALWVAGHLRPGKKIVASAQAHYTHHRISDVLGLRFASVPVDRRARMHLDGLEYLLQAGDVGTVVATLGTTGTGSIDPLPAILELRERYGFRVHVDAAYGGYFKLADNLEPCAREAFDRIGEADSIVVDPHKHGLQPYGCGCVLFCDSGVGRIYKHNSPYTYFSSSELHLGEISLECSRAGAAAVALWATMQLLPLERGGAFARDLSRCREAALRLFGLIQTEPRYLTAFPPELDIIIWAPRARTASEISRRSRDVFERAAAMDLHLALVKIPEELLAYYWPEVEMDDSHVTCLRSCLMKPEHLDWVERIWAIVRVLAEEQP